MIPKEYRAYYDIKENEKLEIVAMDEGILIKFPSERKIKYGNKRDGE